MISTQTGVLAQTGASSTTAPLNADYERAARELKQSALGLAQAWQALRKAGWSSAQLRPVLLALRQLIKGTDRLKLASLRKRTLELEALLLPFVSGLAPMQDQSIQIEACVSMLTSSALALDLSQISPGFVFGPAANDTALPEKAEPPKPVAKVATPTPTPQAMRPAELSARISEPNTVVLLRAERELARGVEAVLAEAGRTVVEVGTTMELEQFLRAKLPGGVIADARFLNGIARQLSALKARPGSAEQDSKVVIVSDRRDLARRLLATRNQTHGYFEEPLDLLEIVSALGLHSQTQSTPETYHALIVSDDKALCGDCARWLLDLQIGSRIERHPVAALTAMLELQPEIVLIDATLPENTALRMIGEARKLTRFASPPVILFVGDNALERREQAIAAGADEYLIAPVKQRHLLSVAQSRIERMRRQVAAAGLHTRNKSGLLPRAEFLAEFAGHPDLSLIFLAVDQTDALSASLPVSAFELLDSAIAALIRPRLRLRELIGYYQDGAYLLGVRSKDERALAELSEKLRASMMQSRIDLGSGPIRITASVAYGALDSAQPAANKALDQLVHACRHGVRTIQASGGNHVRSAASVGLEAPLHAGAKPDVPVGVQMQPLLPVNAKLTNQYLLHFQWRGKTATLHDYVQAARESAAAGFASEFDRRLAQIALARRAAELQRGHQVRFVFEIGASALQDSGFSNWLVAELNHVKLSGSGLSLYCAIDAALAAPKAWQKLCADLQPIGMRFGLCRLEGKADLYQQLARLNFDFVCLCQPELSAGEELGGASFEQIVRKVRERGAMVIATGLTARAQVDQLLPLRVDFATSDALAPAADTPYFDFAAYARA
jgi:DNA-binding response OmpR family regulator/EAL domain-containing protein (putative c-di-GMP-specific phosphodiesterase class I)